MSENRYVDAQVSQAVEALRVELAPVWSQASLPLRLRFPGMGQRRDVAHGMDVIPDGFLLVYADADVIAEPGVLWTTELAFLRAGADYANAIVIFYTLREDIIDA